MKQEIISIIGGDQLHHLCKYLIGKRYQPSLDYFPNDLYKNGQGGTFSVYNGFKWFEFPEDETIKEDDKVNIQYDLSKDLLSQDDQFFKNIDYLLKNI